MKWLKWILIIVILILGLATGLWIFRNHPSAAATETTTKETEATSEKKEEPVAKVSITPLKESTIEEMATLYGTILATSQQLQTYNVPFECRIKQVHVTLGQIVNKDDILVDIEPSPTEKLEIQQARNDVKSADETLKKVKEKFELKLITRQDLIQAQQTLDQAKLKLNSLNQEGIETLHRIKASGYGIVSQLDIQSGQIIPASAVLIAIANNNSIEAKLGVNPEQVNLIKVGQPVWLSLVNRASTSNVKGSIRLITHKINPETRLVDVYVSLPLKHSFLLSDYVTGKITINSAKGFVVPREAVLPKDSDFNMYTIDSGKAVLHHVQIGLENDKEIQVVDKGLSIGMPVVIQGNYELEDGMAVDTSVNK